MTKLYEISKDYIELLESELPADQLKDCLDCVEDAIQEKAYNIVAVVETLDSDTKAIDEQIKRLQARKKVIVNNKENLKDYLRHNMEVTGINKIKHPLFSITLGKSSVIADVFDESLLPDDYITVKTEIKPDKKKILADLKEGIEISGASLSDGKSKLLIK